MVSAGPEIRKLSNDLKMSQVFGKIVAKKFCQIVMCRPSIEIAKKSFLTSTTFSWLLDEGIEKE